MVLRGIDPVTLARAEAFGRFFPPCCFAAVVDGVGGEGALEEVEDD
jgi:hypothetical protein